MNARVNPLVYGTAPALTESPHSMLVQLAGPAWESRAWNLLFEHLTEEDRRRQIASLKELASQADLSSKCLWVALRNDRLLGVLLQIPQPGRIAFVWPPVIASYESRASAELAENLLFQSAARYADDAGLQYSQALLPEGDHAIPTSLGRNGYRLQTTLLVMERELDAQLSLLPATDLVFESYREDPSGEEQSRRVAILLQRTFLGTLDCPTVTRHRSGKDALARHLTGGSASLRHWFIVQSFGRDVALLMLLKEEGGTHWEIDYFGVVPEARGHGYGREIVAWGLIAAQVRGALQMRAVVDSENHYAINTYADCGFRSQSQRTVLLRTHPSLSGDQSEHVFHDQIVS